MPDTLINLSRRYVLSIIVLHEAIEKGMPLSFDSSFARLTVVRDALKLKEILDISIALQCVRPVNPLEEARIMEMEIKKLYY